MNNSPKSTISIRECDASQYKRSLEELIGTNDHLPLLQAPFYGAWQEQDGKHVVYFVASQDEATLAAGIAIKYDAPGGMSFFYCPYGPIVKSWTPELFNSIKRFFKPIARTHNVAFLRLDDSKIATLPNIKTVPNKIAVTASLQPRSEWLLDISGEENALWMGMHKHARYNVRLAERANAAITFYHPSEAPIDTFIHLMETTSDRDSFSLQTRQYYEAVLSCIPPEHGFMALVTIDNKPAAAAIFAEYDKMVHYVFSGSSNDFRKIAPPYFMIWQAILESRRRGWLTFNFGGISDNVKGTHLAGVTGFKKRFGGYEVNHTNPVDLPYNYFKYLAFKLYKTFR